MPRREHSRVGGYRQRLAGFCNSDTAPDIAETVKRLGLSTGAGHQEEKTPIGQSWRLLDESPPRLDQNVNDAAVLVHRSTSATPAGFPNWISEAEHEERACGSTQERGRFEN